MGIKYEFTAGEASASAIEREERQKAALQTVNSIARATGRSLEVTAQPDGGFSHEPGVYLLDAQVAAGGPIREAGFTFEERMLSGAADSAHAVIAGELAIKYGSGKEFTCGIAAKCYEKRTFEERYARAGREIEVMRDMQQRGELGLDPVALAVMQSGGDRSVVLLTRFNNRLYTLDNNPWGRGTTEHNVSNATEAAGALGRFNAMGYMHRDAKIKNVASVAGRGVAMIDFETTDPIDATNPVEAANAAHTDLEYMMGSLADKGLFRLRQNRAGAGNSDAIVGAIQKICEDGYLPAWENASNEVQTAVYDVVAGVAEAAAERVLGQRIIV
ncbi:MAG TPA: hypothetical protein VLA92_01640 [Candidatus Saccharimonadales bacterium]|nr:hypothetical protein [Candidatus Saccharimonadales bacterium]